LQWLKPTLRFFRRQFEEADIYNRLCAARPLGWNDTEAVVRSITALLTLVLDPLAVLLIGSLFHLGSFIAE
jgi:hypothetical protein